VTANGSSRGDWSGRAGKRAGKEIGVGPEQRVATQPQAAATPISTEPVIGVREAAALLHPRRRQSWTTEECERLRDWGARVRGVQHAHSGQPATVQGP
jgi:hypothetical protein